MSDIIPFATGDSGDPYWSYVSLLIQPTSTIIEDLSPQGLTLTAHGDADNIPRGVVDPSSPTGYSIYFPSATSSTDGYISAGVGSQSALPGDFTIEFMLRGGSSGSRSIIGATGWGIGTSTGVTQFNTMATSPAGTLVWDTVSWNHVVHTHVGAREMTFVNGVAASAGIVGNGLGGAGNELIIGGVNAASDYYRQGHLAFLRVTKAARYKPDLSALVPVPTS